jgi:urate oxidase/2-oxo-4-hydroxy-4-carboxy-5-ureidoimidazoline decarboxylase
LSIVNSPVVSPLLDTAVQEVKPYDAVIGYGKAGVAVYRCDIGAQAGVGPQDFSDFTGRPAGLLGADIYVETTGAAFLPSWTAGDNTGLVATDTMKNVVLHHASLFRGTTVEGLAAWVGTHLLELYADMERIRVSAAHLPFVPLGTSGRGYRRRPPAERSTVCLGRDVTGQPQVEEVVTALDGLRLVRLHGSSFSGFHRDAYTTLPETSDRPLEVGLHAHWWYEDPQDAVSDDLAHWVPAEQMEDLIGATVDEMVSGSIQQLLMAIATRALEAFPALARVWLEGENRTWTSPSLPPPSEGATVHTASLPAHGVLRLDLRRSRPVSP